MAPPQGPRAAKDMQVYISGLEGLHPIETGIAYWYRGHYLYGILGNPIQPLQCKREIVVAGTTPDTAPSYNSSDQGLQNEAEIAALRRSMVHEWGRKPWEDYAETQAVRPNETVPQIVEPASGDQTNQTQQPRTSATPDMAPAPLFTTSRDLEDAVDRFYNASALFLAASAPGSRPISPRNPSGDSSDLRAVASMTGVSEFLAGNAPASSSRLRIPSPGLQESSSMPTFAASLALASSQPASRPLSRVPSALNISRSGFDIGPPESRPLSRVPSATGMTSFAYPGDVRSPTRVSNRTLLGSGPGPGLRAGTPTVIPQGRYVEHSSGRLLFEPDMPLLSTERASSSSAYPIGTGRPRRESMTRASRALNESYNTVRPLVSADQGFFLDTTEPGNSGLGRPLKCPIHGDLCDGVTVTHPYMTEQARQSGGFMDCYPTVTGQGRSIVDWHTLYREESGN